MCHHTFVQCGCTCAAASVHTLLSFMHLYMCIDRWRRLSSHSYKNKLTVLFLYDGVTVSQTEERMTNDKWVLKYSSLKLTDSLISLPSHQPVCCLLQATKELNGAQPPIHSHAEKFNADLLQELNILLCACMCALCYVLLCWGRVLPSCCACGSCIISSEHVTETVFL